jgi:hypothetical protein
MDLVRNVDLLGPIAAVSRQPLVTGLKRGLLVFTDSY